MNAHRGRFARQQLARFEGLSIAVMLLATGLQGGCVTEGSAVADDARYRVKLDTASVRPPDGSLDNKPLLNGAFAFKAPDQFLSYDAHYQLGPTALPDGGLSIPLPGPPVAAASLLGSETFGQRLDTRLPFLLEAPLLLGVQDRYKGALSAPGLSANRSADLKWSPAIGQLGVQWRSLDPLAPQPLDCSLGGSLNVPGSRFWAGADDALKLSGRDCRVFAPERGIAALDVATFSALWQWRGGAGDSAIQLTMIEPQRGAFGQTAGVTSTGYELGASRTQKHGNLSAKTSVAVRRSSDPSRSHEQTGWTARTTLSQQFPDVAVSASLQHASDPLWFVPASVSGGNSFELGLDFKRWIDRQLASQKIGMGLLWSWTEPPVAGQPIDARVLWTLSIFR